MPEPTLEHWHTDAGDADIATLDIPPALGRTRRFRIDVRFVVRSSSAAAGRNAWHALAVEANGKREWQRRIATQAEGDDSLDYAFSAELPAGAALRVRARTQVQAAVRRRLVIEAVEQ